MAVVTWKSSQQLQTQTVELHRDTMIEGSLEVKYAEMEKQRWEESVRRSQDVRRSEEKE